MSKHLTQNDNNPSPTVQPYLVLHFRGDDDGKEWFIDVDGKIDLYLKDWTAVRNAQQCLSLDVRRKIPGIFNWMSQATPLLQGLMQELAERNRVVNRVRCYEGGLKANYVLRHGQFYKWIDVRLEHLPKDASFSQWPDIADYLPDILGQPVSTS